MVKKNKDKTKQNLPHMHVPLHLNIQKSLKWPSKLLCVYTHTQIIHIKTNLKIINVIKYSINGHNVCYLKHDVLLP